MKFILVWANLSSWSIVFSAIHYLTKLSMKINNNNVRRNMAPVLANTISCSRWSLHPHIPPLLWCGEIRLSPPEYLCPTVSEWRDSSPGGDLTATDGSRRVKGEMERWELGTGLDTVTGSHQDHGVLIALINTQTISGSKRPREMCLLCLLRMTDQTLSSPRSFRQIISSRR